MIAVFIVDLTASAVALEVVEADCPRLSEAENRRALAFADADRRTHWRAAHIALRLVLERTAGSHLRGLPFTTNRFGRPALPAPGPYFSLSHTTGLAVVAVARSEHVGVDVEARRQIAISPERRARLIAAGIAAGAGEPADAIAAWTRLEALGKARGTGVGPLLSAVRLSGGGSRLEAAAAAAALVEEADLRIVDLPLPRGYAGALAAPRVEGSARIVHLPSAVEELTAFVAARNAVDLSPPPGHKGA